MCQCRFISCNQCTTRELAVGSGEAVLVWHMGIRELSVPASQFCCETDTALKIINFALFQ